MAAAFDDGLCVYDVDRDQQRVQAAGKGVFAGFLARREKLAAGLGNEIAVVDIATGQTTSQVPGVNYVAALAFSPKGDLVAIGQGPDLVLWNPSDGHSQRITFLVDKGIRGHCQLSHLGSGPSRPGTFGPDARRPSEQCDDAGCCAGRTNND